MDNQRLLVWATFGMLAWLTYQAWQEDYGPQPAPAPAPAAQEGAAETAVPSQGIESLPSLPAATNAVVTIRYVVPSSIDVLS